MRRGLLVLVVCALTLALGPTTAPLVAPANVEARTLSSYTTPATVQKARAENPGQLRLKMETLRKSDALMATLAGAPDQATIDAYLEYFAGAMTVQQAKDFVARTAGKHFEVVGTRPDGEPQVVMVDGPAIQPASCCSCWQAHVAFWAWWAGTEMLCIGAGAAAAVVSGPGGIIVGVVCSGIFYGMSNLPNFDNACR